VPPPVQQMPPQLPPRQQAPLRPYDGPSSGTFTYSGPPVIQNGEVVFRGLPAGQLQLTYDRSAWEGRLFPDGEGYQKIVLRSLKPGSQKKCEVKWQMIK
jgi:hypothetical protein